MIDFVVLTIPVFGLVLLGWIAAKFKILPETTVGVLSAYSFKFALPALVFRLISSQPLSQSFIPSFYLAYLFSGATLMALVYWVFRFIASESVSSSGAYASTGAVSNLGFLGAPLMLAFVGERGVGPLAMGILAEIVVLMSIGAILMGSSGSTEKASAIKIFKGAMLNPVIIAIGLAALFATIEFKLPSALDKLLSVLGGSAGPTALFALGGALASQRVAYETWLSASIAAIAKLVMYPLITLIFLRWVFVLEPILVTAGVILASLPSASSNFVLAQRYKAEEVGVSAGIVISTVLSVITVPAFAWLVHH
jgi:malonate transporter